jgi:magnesium transporter
VTGERNVVDERADQRDAPRGLDRDLEQTRAKLNQEPIREVLTLLGRLGRDDRAAAFRLLGKDRALEVFESLDAELQSELISALRDESVGELFAALDPDDRARLMDELPAGVATRLLAGLDPRHRSLTLTLLGYPPDSTGRAMSPQVVSVRAGQTAAAALARVRARGAEAETVYMLPVLGPGRVVVGVVSLRRLLFCDPESRVSDVMSEPVMVSVEEPQERAAQQVRAAGLIAAPVIDTEGRLVGVLTVDDAMRILEAAEDEDAARVAGSQPLRRPYLSTSVLDLVRSRLGWLLVLVVAATLTVNVLDYFEDTLAQVVTLALFVPLLIGTGGNAGAQAATTVVRALATGEVTPRDIARVVGREVTTGLVLGGTLATAGVLPAGYFAGWRIAGVVCVSLVVICVLATAVGSATPLIARRLGVDPAVVSAPLISTLVDASGLIVYFVLAQLILDL